MVAWVSHGSKPSSSDKCRNAQLFHAVEATDLYLAIARVARMLGRNELKSACLILALNYCAYESGSSILVRLKMRFTPIPPT